MNFPLIKHIDDVLPFLKGREEFILAKKENYTVIDYRYVLPDSFDEPIRSECRGIKFNSEGKIIARPFHKFFNYGEKPHTQPNVVDFSVSHVVTEKLDGSMIHSINLDGRIRFMTRMGISEQSKAAEQLFLTEKLEKALYNFVDNFTLLFEYVGPDNRIVEYYEKPNLILLQCRDIHTGNYWEKHNVRDLAEYLNLESVVVHKNFSSSEDLAGVFSRKVGEGVVVRFENELWLKVKAEEYRRLHRLKENIAREHDLVALIIDGKLDDVISLLSDEDAKKVSEFAQEVLIGITTNAKKIDNILKTGTHLSQKDFAVNHLANENPQIKSACFASRKTGEDPFDTVKRIIRENCNNSKNLESVRPLFCGVRFNLEINLGDEG